MGGSCDETVSSISGDNAGNTYVIGTTISGDIQGASGIYGGGYDVFMAKYDPSGLLVWKRYFGGSGNDFGKDIRLESGRPYVYIVGTTGSPDFPTTPGVYQSSVTPGRHVFIAKFNASDGSLIWASLLGGNGDDNGVSIAVQGDCAFVLGDTTSTNLTPVNAFQPANAGRRDIFAAKFSPDGTQITELTYLGGSDDDFASMIRTTTTTPWVQAGGFFLVGYTKSHDLHVTPGVFQPANAGRIDVLIAKVNPDGSLDWLSYLGGNDTDIGTGISWEDTGDVIVTGHTLSPNLAVTPDAFQLTKNGGYDVFAAWIKPDGTTILHLTYFGGNDDDYAGGSREDALNTFIAISTKSTDLPTPNGFQTANAGGFDAYLAKFNSAFSKLLFGSYFGGSNDDYGKDVRVFGSDATIDGYTNSMDFPVTDGSVNQGGNDASILSINTGVDVTVWANVLGVAFSVDGVTYSSPQEFSWVPGSSHTISTTKIQPGDTGVQYNWTYWTDGGAISHTVAPTGRTATYRASFTTQYYLTLSSGTGGHLSLGSNWKTSGSTVSISATPSTGYSFGGWTGSGAGSYTGTDNPASITMIAPITETATFIHQ